VVIEMTVQFSFNWFTIGGAVHAAVPGHSDDELCAAYESMIGRGNMFAPDMSPPLTPLQLAVRDVIVRLAQEHHEAVSKIPSHTDGHPRLS
jgi:hypothetical protein